MIKLKKYKFNELYQMSSGISSKPEQAGHGAPFVSFRTVFNNYFLPDELPDLMDTSEKEQQMYSIKKGDILMTRTSETLDELGMSCVAIKDYPEATYSGFLKRLRPITEGIVYEKYMAFYLRSKLFRKTMTNNAIMTLRASFNEDIFSYLNLYLPDYESQKSFGDFLFLLESKIKLNNRINAELEAMAKTIYDYWFVQFDFPINSEFLPSGEMSEGQRGYKSSGGKMVWSEELKREVPEGWEVKSLFDTMDVQYGFPFSTEMFSDDSTGKPIIRIRDILENSISTYSTEDVDEKYMLIKNDLLIGMDGNFHLNFWDKTGAYLNQRSVRIRAKEKSTVSNFQAYFELNPYIKAREKNTTRTTVAHLSDKDLKRLHLLVCPNHSYFKPKEFFDPILNKITTNRIENQQLSSLRDWLLPMLMNGQVVSTPLNNREKIPLSNMEEEGGVEGLMAAEPKGEYAINKNSISFKSSQKRTIGDRTILAAYLINQFNGKGFGRVMLMKLLFLTEYMCELDFDSHYKVNVAGPYDDLIQEIELKLRTYKFYDAKQDKFDHHVMYEPMGGAVNTESYFYENFSQEADLIHSVLTKFKTSNWEQCEIIATMYAVWNNRIINGDSINDMALKQDFLNWDPQKIKYKDRLDAALTWMHCHEVIPKGWGKIIEK